MPKRSRLSTGGISPRRKRLAEVLAGRDILSQFGRWQIVHPNVITPHVISVQSVGKRLVEFSEGTGLSNQPFYGVTALERTGKDAFKTLHELKVMGEDANQSFYSKVEAKKHVARVFKQLELMK